jgi:hypothetical protein
MSKFDVVEASIAELRAALEDGSTTSVELVEAYQDRIATFDGPDTETRLNSVIVANPQALAEAAASDERRANGDVRGPLDGIPYTAKDSYMVAGLTVASGSPGVFRPRRAEGCLYDRTAARRRRDLPGADEHAADGQRRHAARTLRSRRESLQRRLADQCLRLRIIERVGHGHDGELRGLRPRRGDVVLGPGTGLAQCAHRLHPLAWGSSVCAGTGRSCRPWTSSSPTPARWPTSSKSSTSSSATTPRPAGISGAFSRGWRSPQRAPCARIRMLRCCREAPRRPARCSRICASECRACTSTPMRRPGRTRTAASAGRQASESPPVPR